MVYLLEVLEIDTINYSLGIKIYSPIERKNNMSFNCIYMNNNEIILGSDSRESFPDGTYNDNFQKTFVNKELKMIWSMTGLIRYQNINYIDIVNNIMNMKTQLIEKIYLIQHILKYPTKQIYAHQKEDCIFDMFIGEASNSGLKTYVIEVKNGECSNCTNKIYSSLEAPICSGVHTEYWKYLNLEIMDLTITDLTIMDLTVMDFDKQLKSKAQEMYRLIHSVKEIDKSCTHNTVGGTVYVAIMDKKGNIKTYIDGVEEEFT